MNVKLSYLYRDAGNYKKFGYVVMKDDTQLDLRQAEDLILCYLIDGLWFSADKWNLPDLHFSSWSELDHDYHEFEGVTYTDEAENFEGSLLTFLESVQSSN